MDCESKRYVYAIVDMLCSTSTLCFADFLVNTFQTCTRPHRLEKLARWLISACLIAAFIWKAIEALNKYALGDTMIVSKVRQAKYQTFPTVTLCKGMFTGNQGNLTETEIDNILEINSRFDDWLLSATFDDKYVLSIFAI